MDNRQSWTVGILCYNEVSTVEQAAVAADAVLKEISNGDYEILVVDDGSTDGSIEKIREIEKRLPRAKGIFHETNKGIGEALRSVYFNARKENVIASPADGQFDIEELKGNPILGRDEFVSFYRRKKTAYSPYRIMLSGINRRLNEILIGISLRDVNWTKVYKTEIVKQLDLQLHSSLVESEICAKLLYLGFNVKEVESRFLPRTAGVSKGESWRIVNRAVREIWTLLCVMREFKAGHKVENRPMLRRS